LFTKRHFAGIAVLTAAAISLSACAGTPAAPSDVDAATATSAEAFGGIDGLVAAAQAEGQLNVIALPDNWANYGEIKALFEEKYGITVNSADPDISSAEEITAAENLKGQDTAPDVFDLGTAVTLDSLDYFAPYQVANWAEIPDENKESTGLYVNDYTGSMSIGYDSNSVPAPTSLDDLLKPEYKGAVALNGDPTQAGAAFAAIGLAEPSMTSPPESSSSRSSTTRATSSPSTRRQRRSPRARRRSSSTGATTTSPQRRRSMAGRSSPCPARCTRATTTRPSTLRRRTRPPLVCGRSSSTAPRPRTSSSWAAPTPSRSRP